MSTSSYDIPVGHIDDPESIKQLNTAYRKLHDGDVEVAVGRWHGEVTLAPPSEKTAYRFIVKAEDTRIALFKGDPVRGGKGSMYSGGSTGHATVLTSHQEQIWPGDAIISNDDLGSLPLSGSGVYFEVIVDTTPYPAPKLSLLRNLDDHPGGCAPYGGAFRRETVPSAAIDPSSPDRIGANRVNEHTLDMRIDRQPPPTRHHHGTVIGPEGGVRNHTETAIVLSRADYGLPEIGDGNGGHAIIYRDPSEKGIQDAFTIPVTPGSIVVTPSTSERLFGHCFENAFAMLVAIPGFVVPYERIREKQ